MFELASNTIVKFNGNGRFVELSQAFQIGKIKFAFRVYDDNRPQGNRITSSLDCYIDIDEAVALADRCVSRDLFTIAGKKKKYVLKETTNMQNLLMRIIPDPQKPVREEI